MSAAIRVNWFFQIALSGVLLLSGASMAGKPPVIVTRIQDANAFLQVASSGRKNIAASNGQVGLVWEEVRSGKATVYTAFKGAGESQFSAPIPLSEGDAFSPVIAYCDNRFYLSWIEDGAVKATTVEKDKPGDTVTLKNTSRVNELSIGCADSSALLAYSVMDKHTYAVYATRLIATQNHLKFDDSVAVAPVDTFRFQTNPGIAFNKGRIVITWHDRSSGTNLLYATSGKTLKALSDTIQINELIQKSYEWGSGSSAISNTLANGPKQRLVVVWLDKRASRTGYKVYSAFSHDGGLSWGDNYIVSDEWGDIVPAWTPAIASDGNKRLATLWMDKREEDNALWISKLAGLSWSQDKKFQSGDTQPQSPVIAYSPDGHLHAAWIQEDSAGVQLVYQESR